MISYFIIGSLLWALTTFLIYIKNKREFKITRNLVSTTHACGVIISSYLNLDNHYLYYWSVCYYITDAMYEIYTIRKIYNLGMLLHHIVTIGVLNYLLNPITMSYMRTAFLLSEISNLPMYLVYHLKSNKFEQNIMLRLLIFVEAMGFLFLRLFWGGFILYEIIFINPLPIPMCISGTFILIISLLWTIKLIKQVFN